jgi:hypothetical protein
MMHTNEAARQRAKDEMKRMDTPADLKLVVVKISCRLCRVQRLNDGTRCKCGAYENRDIVPVAPDVMCRFCMKDRGCRQGTTQPCLYCGSSPVLTNEAFKPRPREFS